MTDGTKDTLPGAARRGAPGMLSGWGTLMGGSVE